MFTDHLHGNRAQKFHITATMVTLKEFGTYLSTSMHERLHGPLSVARLQFSLS